MTQLKDLIQVNKDFKNAVNLYLDLNKTDKIESYIPTKSSVDILEKYLDAIINNTQQATMLIGPYGKGKSHLLLVLLAILSLDRNTANKKIIGELSKRIGSTNKDAAEKINNLWKQKSKGKFLPVIIMSTQGDLNQAFMVGLNEALKREGLTDLAPETYFTYAIDTIQRWEKEYPDTYENYKKALKRKNITEKNMLKGLSNFDNLQLDIFKSIYPELTSGEVFNPLVNSEVQPMYKNIADKLREEYGYSGIYIIFDEFSKYIEGQDKKAGGHNMKILQDMCELANSSKETQIFVTMVAHKSIKEYGKYLSVETINSYTGIDGRIKEVYFITSSKNNYELIKNAIKKDDVVLESEQAVKNFVNDEVADKYFEMVAFSSVFTRNDFMEMIVKGCYPLSPTSAYLLLNISEKVAQNERTLFTFISKDEQYSMINYIKNVTSINEWIINANLIYDYFKNLFKKEVSNEHIHTEWLNAEYALSLVEESAYINMLKTLAVVNIVNKQDEFPSDLKHLRLATGMEDAEDILNELTARGLVYKKGSNNCYAFKTRATSELKTEIKKRKELKGDYININEVLNRLSEVKYVLPRGYNYGYSMTRYFRYEYMDVEEFLQINDLQVIFKDGLFCDGKVIALYSINDSDYTEQIKKHLENNLIDKLVVVYGNNKLEIQDQIQEYEVLQELKIDVSFFNVEENKILLKEIPVVEEDVVREIEDYIQQTFGRYSQSNVLYINDGAVEIEDGSFLTDIVDSLCRSIYYRTITIPNELINKEIIKTGAIKRARKILVDFLLNKGDIEQFLDGSSAEATIYRAVFIETGIHSNYVSENVEFFLNTLNDFITGATNRKRCLSEIVTTLVSAPIGLRRGVLPLYLADAISRRNEDIVIYFGEKEIAITTDIIINMCEQPDDYFIFISSEDSEKEHYLEGLSDLFRVTTTDKQGDTRISNIVLSMQRWFRALPQITKNIGRNNDYFGNATFTKAYPEVKKILQDVEPNPYEILFVEFPRIFGTEENYDSLLEMIGGLKEKLRNYYDVVKQDTISKTILVFDSSATQDLRHTLKEWYDRQSDLAKDGLQSSKITNLMACITDEKTYSDMDIIEKLVKIVSEIYMDTWNDSSQEVYLKNLLELKEEVEHITDSNVDIGKCKLSFVGRNGKIYNKYYEPVDESTGAIFRNVLSDVLEDYSEISTNDKIAILLELIEKEIG